MKQNPNYEQSAENLINPPEVRDLLAKLSEEQVMLEIYQLQLEETNSDLMTLIRAQENNISTCTTEIKKAIDQYGSYQDQEDGFYAVKYRRMMRSYHPEPLKQYFPKFAPLLIEETVNVKALDGQIKGGLLNLDELKEKGIISEIPQYAFYIKC